MANDGYGDSKPIEVVRSQVTKVDLEEYKGEGPKLCQVTFEVNVEGAFLYINGEAVDYSEPVELRYGVHRLTVIADGFETWERQLVIHSEETTIQIGEPLLSDEDEDRSEGEQKDKNKEKTGKKNKNNSNSAGEDDSDDDDDSETVTSEEKGTSYSDVEDSSNGDYGDYVDTIVDLIESLMGLNN